MGVHWSSTPNKDNVSNRNQAPQLFHFNQDRFYTYISTLEDAHKTIFVDLVEHKYNVSIARHQIVLLPLSQFECKLRMYTNEGKKIVLNGGSQRSQDHSASDWFLNSKSGETNFTITLIVGESLIRGFNVFVRRPRERI